MQTFVPYIGNAKIAECLDNVRLWKQGIEVEQILGSLENGTGYKNHPVNDMWRGYEPALTMYGLAMLHEHTIVRKRPDREGVTDRLFEYASAYGLTGTRREESGRIVMDGTAAKSAPWREDRDVMRSHRSNLCRKLAAHYRHRFPGQADDWAYLWPRIDDGDTRGYRLFLSKATLSPGRFGVTEFLPEWLRVDESTREVLPA